MLHHTVLGLLVLMYTPSFVTIEANIHVKYKPFFDCIIKLLTQFRSQIPNVPKTQNTLFFLKKKQETLSLSCPINMLSQIARTTTRPMVKHSRTFIDGWVKTPSKVSVVPFVFTVFDPLSCL